MLEEHYKTMGNLQQEFTKMSIEVETLAVELDKSQRRLQDFKRNVLQENNIVWNDGEKKIYRLKEIDPEQPITQD